MAQTRFESATTPVGRRSELSRSAAAFTKFAASFLCCGILLLVIVAGLRVARRRQSDPSQEYAAVSDAAYQCNPGAALHDIQLWTDERRAWCCVKFKVGCPYKVCHSTDTLPEEWPLEQQNFCCEMEGIACPSARITTTIKPLPFDCMLGPDGTTAGWTQDKRDFCCHYSLRGCPTRTSTTITGTTTTETTTSTTARPTIMVPFPACAPDDKDCTTLYPTPLPLVTTTPAALAYAEPAAAAAYGGYGAQDGGYGAQAVAAPAAEGYATAAPAAEGYAAQVNTPEAAAAAQAASAAQVQQAAAAQTDPGSAAAPTYAPQAYQSPGVAE